MQKKRERRRTLEPYLRPLGLPVLLCSGPLSTTTCNPNKTNSFFKNLTISHIIISSHFNLTMKFTTLFLAALLLASVALACPCKPTSKENAESQCSGKSECQVGSVVDGQYTCCKVQSGRQMVLKDGSERVNVPTESHGYWYCRISCVCCSGRCSCWRLCKYCY